MNHQEGNLLSGTCRRAVTQKCMLPTTASTLFMCSFWLPLEEWQEVRDWLKTVSWADDVLVLHELMPSFIFASSCFSLSSVCGPAELPAAAGHAVVRRLPRLEETTLGRQTGHLPRHRPPVSRLLTGRNERTVKFKATKKEGWWEDNRSTFIATDTLCPPSALWMSL